MFHGAMIGLIGFIPGSAAIALKALLKACGTPAALSGLIGSN